jgi:hypothetical protein
MHAVIGAFRRLLPAFCCAIATLCPTAVLAQQPATLQLQSGEQLIGTLLELGGLGFVVQVTGQERQVPMDEVASIDFTPDLTRKTSAADWSSFKGHQQVVLRDGQVIDGEIYDIRGGVPLKITLVTADGTRELASTQVARILFARPRTAQPAAPARSGSGGA